MKETLRKLNIGNYHVVIDVVGGEDGSNWLDELYTPTDDHQAGITIKNPEYDRYGDRVYKYYIGQYTPAQLASDYAKQGRENPSHEAYKSLQRELGWYCTAADYSLRIRVYKGDTMIAEHYGINFEYSWEYSDESLEDHVSNNIWPSYGRDNLSEAISQARDTMSALCQ